MLSKILFVRLFNRKWIKVFALLLPALFFANVLLSQSIVDSALQNKLDSLLSSHFKPTDAGCEVLVSKAGSVVYKKSFGQANLELQVALQPDMVFRLGSITKQFTAVAILQLVEQGKISLNDSILKFIPDYPTRGYHITIENLLTHTSGIKDYTQMDYADPFMERRDFSPKQLIDSFKNAPLEFEPGTKFNYSNSGYFLLGYIIERVTGQTYQSYIQDNLLTPLGLTHTYFDSAGIIIPNRVAGYKKVGADYRNADYWSMSVAYAAGGLLSNAEDLYKWHQGLYSYHILKKETLEKAFTSYKLKDGSSTDYGYGWFIRELSGSRSIEHGGAISGFLANEIYYPAEDVFIAALFNCECAAKDELSISIASIALGKSLQLSKNMADSALDKFVGTYKLSVDPKRTIIISKEGDHLIAKVSGQSSFKLLFQSPTKFLFQNILGAECEFIIEGGKVAKMNVMQNGLYVWVKS